MVKIANSNVIHPQCDQLQDSVKAMKRDLCGSLLSGYEEGKMPFVKCREEQLMGITMEKTRKGVERVLGTLQRAYPYRHCTKPRMMLLCETPEQVLRQDVLILGQTKLGAILLATLKFQLETACQAGKHWKGMPRSSVDRSISLEWRQSCGS